MRTNSETALFKGLKNSPVCQFADTGLAMIRIQSHILFLLCSGDRRILDLIEIRKGWTIEVLHS